MTTDTNTEAPSRAAKAHDILIAWGYDYLTGGTLTSLRVRAVAIGYDAEDADYRQRCLDSAYCIDAPPLMAAGSTLAGRTRYLPALSTVARAA